MMVFENRKQAGKLLAEKLQNILENPRYKSNETVVLGLPRGGVPVALEISLLLQCSIDILVAKKIGAPGHAELAVGAVSSGGVTVIDERLNKHFPNLDVYIESEKERLIKETVVLEKHWLDAANMRERPSLSNKNVVIVDDGIATGMTTLAAIKTVRQSKAASIIIATPVIPPDTYKSLLSECDALAALIIPYEFHAVGNYYLDFHQVEDQEVIDALKSRVQ